MLPLVLITLLFAVGYANECPYGTQQIGVGVLGHTYISGSYKKGVTVEDCKYYCLQRGRNCKAFTFDDDYNGAGLSLCVPYKLDRPRDVNIPDDHPQSDQVLCAMEMCPLGTAQVGGAGAIGTKPLIAQNKRGAIATIPLIAQNQRTGIPIEECRDWCYAHFCDSFTFDDNYRHGSGFSVEPYSLCILYGDDEVAGVKYRDTHPRGDQLLCAIRDGDSVICPAGTTQIATTGSRFYGPSIYYYVGMRINTCRYYCDKHPRCHAISFDSDKGDENVSPSLCRLYDANSDTRIGKYHTEHAFSDQVLCALPTFSAQSPGVFNFDSISMIDGNGNVTEITGNYVIYIIGFICIVVVINVICLMMYCWKKLNKRNKMNYKLVSMRSDAETDIEHQ